jgi:sporulation protein YlmC with PRC-barrel domain
MTPARLLSCALTIVSAALAIAVGTAEEGRAGSSMYREAEDDSLLIDSLNLTVGQIDDMAIVSSTGEWVGQVDGVVMDSAGQIVAILIESENKKALVRLDEFKLDGSRLVTSITRADVQTLGVWDPDEDLEPNSPPAQQDTPPDVENAPSI